MSKLILGIDSSAAACSAALLSVDAFGADFYHPDRYQMLARDYAELERGHATVLMPMIDAVLADAGVDYDNIDALAVAIGPGSYTGLRIGIATARGLALATNAPTIGIATTLAVGHRLVRQHADRVADCDALVIAMDTKRADIYLHIFTVQQEELVAPMALSVEAAVELLPAGSIFVGGNAAERLLAGIVDRQTDWLADDRGLPDALDVALLGATQCDGRATAAPTPLYLRPADVTLAKPKIKTA